MIYLLARHQNGSPHMAQIGKCSVFWRHQKARADAECSGDKSNTFSLTLFDLLVNDDSDCLVNSTGEFEQVHVDHQPCVFLIWSNAATTVYIHSRHNSENPLMFGKTPWLDYCLISQGDCTSVY